MRKIYIFFISLLIVSCQKSEVKEPEKYISVTDAYFIRKNEYIESLSQTIKVFGKPDKQSFTEYLSGKTDFFELTDPVTGYFIDVDLKIIENSLKEPIYNKLSKFPDTATFYFDAYYQVDLGIDYGNSDVKIFLNDTNFFYK